MVLVGGLQHLLSVLIDRLRLTQVQHRRCQQADATMVVVVVIPIEEGLTETASIFHRTKELGKLGLVLEGLELRFGEGIVIGDIRTRVGLSHPSIREQEGNGF